MPLKEGSSKSTIATNIEHCMSNYKSTGKVSGKTVSAKKARSMCAAMAYSSAKKTSTNKSLVDKLKGK